MFNIRVTTTNGLERQLLSLSKIILQTQVTSHCPILLMCYLLKSSRTAIKPGKMTNLQIHDTFEVEEQSELTTVVKDDIQVETELNRIWSQSEKKQDV